MDKNKTFIILTSVILSFNGVDAMDMVLALPYKGINVIYNFFQKKVVIAQKNFDLLPREVQGKIAKTVFRLSIIEQAPEKYINQEALEKYPLKIPMVLSLNYINEFLEMEKICQKEIGCKKILAEQLFMLPKKEQDVFVRMANRSAFHESNIDNDDYWILSQTKHQNIIEGMHFVVTPKNKIFVFLDHAQVISLKIMVSCLCCSLIPITIACAMSKPIGPYAAMIVFTPVITSLGGLLTAQAFEVLKVNFDAFCPQLQWKCEKREGTALKGYHYRSGGF